MKQFNSEIELAEQIINHLTKMGWEVYQEVQVFSYGNIADIVATRDNIVWVLECKLSLSLSLLEQAHNWQPLAHYVSIVVPRKKQNKQHGFTTQILKHFGIGCFTIRSMDNAVIERTTPKLNKNTNAEYLQNCLTEQHKTWAKAGNSDGKRYTPFQDTKDQLIRFVTKTPGLPIKKVIAGIKHHYRKDSTARACILQWIHRGIITEVKLKHVGKKYLVYPTQRKKTK